MHLKKMATMVHDQMKYVMTKYKSFEKLDEETKRSLYRSIDEMAIFIDNLPEKNDNQIN